MGAAVQSHWFQAASDVLWVEAGVGAIATQSFVDPRYGLRGLELLRQGKLAPDVLRQLVEADAGRDTRQVAMMDSQGHVATHTGTGCIEAAGHQVGNQYSVQANLMADSRVWPAMAEAYEKQQATWLIACWRLSTRPSPSVAISAVNISRAHHCQSKVEWQTVGGRRSNNRRESS